MSRKPQPVTLTSNSFAALASDSDEEVSESKPSPPFRVWSLDDAEKRFKHDTNIFSSPFARKKAWSKPRFKEDWVSIEVGKEEVEVEVGAGAGAEAEEETHEFPSMLSRGDQERAVLWAEKVKKSLERAEKVRVEFKRGKDTSSDIGTRLSFFRSGTLGIDKD
jgi:broad specificity phosphatase PhoE